MLMWRLGGSYVAFVDRFSWFVFTQGFDSATYDVEMYMQKAGLDFVGRYDPKYVHVPLISGD